MNVTIEIPDEIKCGDKIYVPTGEYRQAKKGESILESDSCIYTYTCSDSQIKAHIYKEKRWRAGEGGVYWFCTGSHLRTQSCTEDWLDADDNRYNSGNYFKTEGECAKYATAIRKLLIERKL